jgi:hypothetical protein
MRAPLVASSLILLLSATAAAAPLSVGPTISVDEIKPGMEGYGLTVFQGQKPERFPIKVIAVMRNFLPKEDIILIRSEDPRLVHAGIAQGMSGSPIYLDNRLAGALSYGWGFSKDALAGVTPIASMVRELERPLRPIAEADTPLQARGATGELQPASLPLEVAGMRPDAVAALTEALAPYHIVPQQAGGTGGGARAKRASGTARFEPGSAIAVELIRGDVSATATGTVTAIAGDRLLAFGHPMFSAGQIDFPIATAEIHGVMASVNTSFKLSSPGEEAGALLQDRQACIVGDMKMRAPMIPVTVVVRTPDKNGAAEERFVTEVARHRFLTPTLVATVLGSAASAAASDVSDATAVVKTRLAIHGHKPIELVDHLFAPDGVQARMLATTQGLRAVNELFVNPFEPVVIDRIDVEIDVRYRADVAELVEAGLSAETVEPGSRPSLRIVLRPFGKPEETMTVPIDIPASLAGQTVKLTVQAGSQTHPDTAPPENLAQLIDNLPRTYAGNAIVVSLELPDEGITLHGHLVPELPGSVLDSLRPSTAVRRSDTLKAVARTIVPTAFITVGKLELSLRVRERH